MMKDTLYLKDSYIKQFATKVVEANDKFVFLDKTAFYTTSGGQQNDTGVMKTISGEYKVVSCRKIDGKISHEVDKPGLKIGDNVHCSIDWDRRYKLMRCHTAAHVL